MGWLTERMRGMNEEWRRDEYLISTDRARLDVGLIHEFLSESSYWAQGRPREVVERSIEHSLCFGLYHGERQVGFARVITDYATFAWIADVFVIEEFRGRGLAQWLCEVMLAHPELQRLRRWVLATKDAHELYRRTGFQELLRPERWMERHDPATVERSDYWAAATKQGG
jgi:GNAT superfamily N-acetyltransferase